jgi:hypothetical protein
MATVALGRGQIRFDGSGPERALRFRKERLLVERLQRRLRRQRYVVLHDPSVMEAIGLAAATYSHGDEPWRKADCESHEPWRPQLERSLGAVIHR